MALAMASSRCYSVLPPDLRSPGEFHRMRGSSGRFGLVVVRSKMLEKGDNGPAHVPPSSLPVLEGHSIEPVPMMRAAQRLILKKKKKKRIKTDALTLEDFLKSKREAAGEEDEKEVEDGNDTVKLAPNSSFAQEKSDSVGKAGADESDGVSWAVFDANGANMSTSEEGPQALRTVFDANDEDKETELSTYENPIPRKVIPPEMRCFDRAKICVKAGNGGNGEVAFRREKYVPHGGPSGGNGGNGGNLYVVADSSLNSLLQFRYEVHFRAGDGVNGKGKTKDGRTGTHCTVKVPPGTVVREASSGKVLLDMKVAGEKKLLLPGGRGGRGNAAFKTHAVTAPIIAEKGERGAEMWVELELKLVADAGIIGVPNAGKSTLLSAISAARPTIAAYPFTTLLPNLGVVQLDFISMVVADLPGLLEGAHSGYGLGHEFLRHTERCRVLIHVIDGMSPQPVYEYEAVRLELELFNPKLSSKPFIVAFNKTDIPEAADRWPKFEKAMKSRGVTAFCMSAATTKGTSEVARAAMDLFRSAGKSYTEEEEEQEDMAFKVIKERSAPLGDYRILVDPEDDKWEIKGAGLERFVQMTNWDYFESMKRFERILEHTGINAELKNKGISAGDRVVIGEWGFTWHDDGTHLSWRRSQKGSKKWPK